MSSKDRYGKFKKKHYVRMIDNVRYYLCRKFGYKIKPYIFETQLQKNSLMLFTHTADLWLYFTAEIFSGDIDKISRMGYNNGAVKYVLCGRSN